MKKLFLILVVISLAFAFTSNAQTTKKPTVKIQVVKPGGGGDDPCYCTFKLADGTYCGQPAVNCLLYKCMSHTFIISEIKNEVCDPNDASLLATKPSTSPPAKELITNLE